MVILISDFNCDLNQVIFLSKKSCDFNHSCLYTFNSLYSEIFNTSTTHVLFEIVSVFIYALIECLVEIAPCYFCFEQTTTLTVLGKVI